MAKFQQGNLELLDNKSVIFGDDNDSQMYWDGTELRVSTTISGVDPSSDGHLATKSYVDTQDTTISGDIVAQIPSLTGYATEAYVTTVSGDIVAQIPSDYVSDAEMTTISGDIVAQIPSLAGYATEAYVTTVSGDIITYVDEHAVTVSGMADLVDDETPQLGGDLDTNGHDILFGTDTISGTGTIVTGDHAMTSGVYQVANLCVGTGDPPTASGVPIGTVFIQYTA